MLKKSAVASGQTELRNALKTECTASEYSWISEIIDDLAAQTQSRELIETYKSLMAKFPEECMIYNIAEIIQFAEEALE